MFSDDTKREIKKIGIGNVILSAVMIAVFAALGKFDVKVLCGTLLGAGYAFMNFVLLAISVQKAAFSLPKTAQGKMGLSYSLRYVLTGIIVIMAIKLPVFNYVAAVIPLLFPRITITVTGLIGKGK